MELTLETGQVLGNDQIVSACVKRSIDPIYGYLQKDKLEVKLLGNVDLRQAAAGQAWVCLRHKNQVVAHQQMLSCRQTGLGQTLQCATNLDFLRLECMGGMYQNENGMGILKELLGHRSLDTAGDSLIGKVTGHIPVCNRGQAMRMLTFALGAYMQVNPMGDFGLEKLEGKPKEIPGQRILSPITVTHLPEYSRVELVTHGYTPGQQQVVLFSEKELSDQVQTYYFPEPVHWFYLAQSVEQDYGPNFVTFRPVGLETLTVKPYLHTTNYLSRDLFTPADMEHTRVLSVRDNTLISPENGPALLDDLVERAKLRQKLELTIAVAGERIGSAVTVQTPDGRTYSGYITRMDSTYSREREIADITVMGKEI